MVMVPRRRQFGYIIRANLHHVLQMATDATGLNAKEFSRGLAE